MPFEQDKACNMSGEKLQNFEKLFLAFKAWHNLFSFIFMDYVMTCILFVIESLQLYILYLVASTVCKTRKNGSEPPKQETKRSEVRNNRLSSDSVWCVCTCVCQCLLSFACQCLIYIIQFHFIIINYNIIILFFTFV